MEGKEGVAKKKGLNSVEKLLFEAGKLILSKKGQELVVIDVRGLCSYADYILVASARSTRQVKALAEHLRDELGKAGVKPLGTEGIEYGNWALLDYDEVIVHIFYAPVREYYEIEGIWADAERIWIEDESELAELARIRRTRSRKAN